MSKLLTIDNCNDCKHIGETHEKTGEVHKYFSYCERERRIIPAPLNQGIPSWCTLPDADK